MREERSLGGQPHEGEQDDWDYHAWDYHAFVTDRDLPLAVEADHRRHAVVEQTAAELNSARFAHLPSGRFMANAAWLALVMAHNLGRAVGQLASPKLQRATAATPPASPSALAPVLLRWSAGVRRCG